MDKTCLHCGTNFVAENSRRKWCSSNCRARACERRNPKPAPAPKPRPCAGCGVPLPKSKRICPNPTCSNKPRAKQRNYDHRKAPCAACGQLAWKSHPPAQDGLTYCRKCSRPTKARPAVATEPKIRHVVDCDWCGMTFKSPSYYRPRYCSRVCANTAVGQARRAKRQPTDQLQARWERKDRERMAIGLGYGARRNLLKKWKRQGRSCAYCTAPVTTVDHVIPLSRGGTNYEGNLVPCCKRCNSQKSDRLVIEWRLGKPAGYTRMRLLTREPRPEPKPKRKRVAVECYICGTSFDAPEGSHRRTCGPLCSDEHTRRLVRERYRARNGLPPTWDVPVRRRAA